MQEEINDKIEYNDTEKDEGYDDPRWKILFDAEDDALQCTCNIYGEYYCDIHGTEFNE